jgi:hypothetical protein
MWGIFIRVTYGNMRLGDEGSVEELFLNFGNFGNNNDCLKSIQNICFSIHF